MCGLAGLGYQTSTVFRISLVVTFPPVAVMCTVKFLQPVVENFVAATCCLVTGLTIVAGVEVQPVHMSAP